jgi:hypothetical protein
MTQPIRVGTAGWSDPAWKGQVSPQLQPRGFEPLRSSPTSMVGAGRR